MAELDERSWAEAIGMYARRYTVAKVTSRKHEEWALDLSALMHGDTRDSRDWQVCDPLLGEFERVDDPYYPFVVPPNDLPALEAWKARLQEIPRSSAKRFLVALSTLWLNVEKEEGFGERRAALEEKADVVLSRFPQGSRFYANTGRDSENLDYYERIPGCNTISVHIWDLGLFLVSDAEVGMVWSFHAW
ncbi:hypothetical protein QFZ66_002680 [Streptomyces sp. B4I13]|uniref:hypothetical protein n=1 Tax=Streptomyces sp. B4I13 TaxID=3042271 RepID=UPI0027869645|nr:hypothetical protein [Streptomyces sp. B4I13]MDQ0958802.1 hypothetical protein [Streptomyces sp. B4I13]